MKTPLVMLALSLAFTACGGPTGSPNVTVTGPSSNLLKMGEPTTFTAIFKDAGGANQSKTFTWISSNPTVAEVDATGKVTGKRLGKATITASADGVSGSSDVQTFGLEVVGGTHDFGAYDGKPPRLSVLIRFRSPSTDAIPANTPFTVAISGPNAWNAGATVNSGPFNMGVGGVSTSDTPAYSKDVVSGAYQASTTIAGVTYTSSFTVDATQLQARVPSISQTSATASAVNASWTAASGAAQYRMYVGDPSGFKGNTFTTATNAALTGLSLDTGQQNFVFVAAMNFKVDAGLDAVAPAQFNVAFGTKAITF